MDVTLALLADYANVSREGKLNLMGLFTQINARQLPWVHPQMQLVLELEAGAAEWDQQKDVVIKLIDADGKELISVTGNVKVPRGQGGKKSRINSIMTFGNVQFPSEGDYAFHILVGGDTKKEIPLTVTYVPPYPKEARTPDS